MNGSGGSGGVASLNGLSGALTLLAGSGITITPGAGTLTIAASGGSGANTELSNLTSPTAINQDLTFASGAKQIIAIDDLSIVSADSTIFFDSASGDIKVFADSNYFRVDTLGDLNGAQLKILGSNGLFLQAQRWPDADGTANQFLKTDGAGTLSWDSPSAGAAGNPSEVQYNTAGALDASPGLTFDPLTNTLSVHTAGANSVLNVPLQIWGNPDQGMIFFGTTTITDAGAVFGSDFTGGNYAYIQGVLGDYSGNNDFKINPFGGNVFLGHTAGTVTLTSTTVVAAGDVASATLTPANGATGTFTTVDLKTVTVTNGIITSIV